MKVYIFAAAIICSDCAAPLLTGLEPDEDSDHYPQGPYESCEQIADSPDHCDMCGCFTGNPLTDYGEEYVRDALREYAESGRGNADVLDQWADFYGLSVEN